MGISKRYLERMNRDAEIWHVWRKVIARYVVDYLRRHGVTTDEEIKEHLSNYPYLLASLNNSN